MGKEPAWLLSGGWTSASPPGSRRLLFCCSSGGSQLPFHVNDDNENGMHLPYNESDDDELTHNRLLGRKGKPSRATAAWTPSDVDPSYQTLAYPCANTGDHRLRVGSLFNKVCCKAVICSIMPVLRRGATRLNKAADTGVPG